MGPLINRRTYDARPVYAKEKTGVTVGMAMTEKQGGSDLRATMTTARPATARHGSGAPYLLTGHKWFFSVPMSDLFLTLAQTDKGLSCFFATGWLPYGSRNRLKIQRLTDKCGNKSNASSEVEFYDLHAVMLGDEGRDISTIIEMAHATRLDFAIGSTGLMRQALSQAIHHTTNRRAFQRGLIDLPIMRNVIADLAVESEAMMWMSMRLARALDTPSIQQIADRLDGKPAQEQAVHVSDGRTNQSEAELRDYIAAALLASANAAATAKADKPDEKTKLN
jgi:putative acyl-CoA dehydrogenase